MNLWTTCIKANDSIESFITLRKHPSISNSIILHFHHTFSLQLPALLRIHFIDWLLSIGKNCTESKEMSINYTPGRILHYKTLQRKSTIPTYEQRKHLKFPGRADVLQSSLEPLRMHGKRSWSAWTYIQGKRGPCLRRSYLHQRVPLGLGLILQ